MSGTLRLFLLGSERSDEVASRVEIFTSLVVVVHKDFSFLDESFRKEENCGLPINLATNCPYVLACALRIFHAVVDPVEESCNICMLVRNYDKGRRRIPCAEKLHYRVVNIKSCLHVRPNLAKVLGNQCQLW